MLSSKKIPFFVFLLLIGGFLILVPCLYAFIVKENHIAIIFLQSALINFLISGALLIAIIPKEQKTSNESIKTIGQSVLAFLLLPIIFAIPLYQISDYKSFVDSYVEMVNALTTTGLTIYNTELLHPVAHLWRGLVGWFGGGLIWVMTAGVFLNMAPPLSKGEHKFFQSPVSINKIISITAKFFPIYFLLTMLLFGILITAKTPVFDAIMIAMATFSTSGILGHSPYLETSWIAQLFIFIGLFFAFSRTTMTKNITYIGYNPEMRTAIFIIIICINFVWLSHFVKNFSDQNTTILFYILNTLWQDAFFVTSFLSTTGFVTKEMAMMVESNSSILIISMALCALGGGVATTAGGFKLLRFYLLMDHSRREMTRIIHPSYLSEKSILPREKRIKITIQAWNLLFFTLAIFVFSALSISFSGYDYKTALILAISALSNTGPLVNFISEKPFYFNEISTFLKFFLVIIMIVGRVEILGAVAFFGFIRNK